VAGTGLSAGQRVAARGRVAGRHPLVVARRSLAGRASAKGQGAGVTKAPGERALARGGPAGLARRLAAARPAAGPLRAWRQGAHGLAALARWPAARPLDQAVRGPGAGQRLADPGLRRPRQLHRQALGAAPAVGYLGGCYGGFAPDDVLALRGAPVRQRLRPAPRPARPPTDSP
jgi:hypothetical protein